MDECMCPVCDMPAGDEPLCTDCYYAGCDDGEANCH